MLRTQVNQLKIETISHHTDAQEFDDNTPLALLKKPRTTLLSFSPFELMAQIDSLSQSIQPANSKDYIAITID
jgi:hypothetical protein